MWRAAAAMRHGQADCTVIWLSLPRNAGRDQIDPVPELSAAGRCTWTPPSRSVLYNYVFASLRRSAPLPLQVVTCVPIWCTPPAGQVHDSMALKALPALSRAFRAAP